MHINNQTKPYSTGQKKSLRSISVLCLLTMHSSTVLAPYTEHRRVRYVRTHGLPYVRAMLCTTIHVHMQNTGTYVRVGRKAPTIA